MSTKHGYFGTPTYRSWGHMIGRCTNPRDHMFKDYGAKGIRVVPEWVGAGGFARFLEHVGERPSLAHSIDRIDGAKGYEPGNVRWATAGEQARNRKSNVRVTIDGVTKCAADWASEHGVSPDTAHARIKKGWDGVRAVTERPRKQRNNRSIHT
jgi:hypothetical protein